MKRNSILICLLFAITATTFTTAKAQVNTTDSLALVDLYNSTNGPHWNYNTNWLTTAPVSTWHGIHLDSTNRVVEIDLFLNSLSGAIPASIGSLTSLKFLNLSYNYLRDTIPSSIYNLTNLSNLDLYDNGLTGTISTEIGNLINLNYLTLSLNQLTGTIPAEIGNLTNLVGLGLSTNQLSGAIPATLGNLTNLNGIDLSYNGLSGTIPATLGNLTKLTTLYLNFNKLSGTIPTEIGNLINIYYLYLNNNQLSGIIPAEIGNLTNLYYLYLNNNQLSGIIPAEIGNLTNLYYLYLNNNQLSGTVPASLKKLTRLRYIDISYNRLSAFGYANAFTNTSSKIKGSVEHNLFTFDGLQVIARNFHKPNYAPQDTILPIRQNGNTLTVYAGGTLSNNTYKWFKVGSINSTTIKGDSTFSPSTNGQYYAMVTNSIAKKLTLYSDTISYTMPLAQTQNSIANVAAVRAFTNHFSVYPNPAKDLIHVQTNGNAIVTLTNSAGNILLSKSINNSGEINVSGYANGIYYIQNKTTGETQKIIVIH